MKLISWLSIGELIAMVLLLVFGLPADDGSWIQWPATIVHLPGIFLLSELGLCCGYRNALVIPDDVIGPVYRPTPVGVPLLAGANLIAIAVLVVVVWFLIRQIRGSQQQSRAAE